MALPAEQLPEKEARTNGKTTLKFHPDVIKGVQYDAEFNVRETRRYNEIYRSQTVLSRICCCARTPWRIRGRHYWFQQAGREHDCRDGCLLEAFGRVTVTHPCRSLKMFAGRAAFA